MTKRILVIKLGALGDIFLTFDVFHALRRNHPGAHFTFMTRPAYGALAGQMPWFDEVWTDAGPKWWQVGQWLALRRKLRAGRFDRVYDLQSNERTGRYFQMLGKPRPEWVGTVRGCSHQGAPLRPQRLPATQRLFNLVALAGVPSAGRAPLDCVHRGGKFLDRDRGMRGGSCRQFGFGADANRRHDGGRRDHGGREERTRADRRSGRCRRG